MWLIFSCRHFRWCRVARLIATIFDSPLEVTMTDVLVVSSKVKKLIKDKAGMNTAAAVMETLTKVVERECLRAIERAQADKRKTLMEKDFTI